jgi:hypothetical protein
MEARNAIVMVGSTRLEEGCCYRFDMVENQDALHPVCRVVLVGLLGWYGHVFAWFVFWDSLVSFRLWGKSTKKE